MVKKFKQIKAPIVYVSSHRPDDPRRVANLKRYSIRQTPEVINPTNFQPDPPLVLAPRGVEFGAHPVTFQTTPTTNSTNVLLVITRISAKLDDDDADDGKSRSNGLL